MKTAKKSLVLAIVATGTLLGSIGTSSALADVGGHLQVEGSKTATPKGKKGARKASASRKRRGKSTRARNAERRRQRQMKLQREFVELLEMFVVAVEEGDAECADLILDELEENFGQVIDELEDLGDFDDPRDDREPDSGIWWWFRKPIKLTGNPCPVI